MLLLAALLAAVLVPAAMPAPARAAEYNPLMIMSDENWRASGSMSPGDIQAFLEAQPGVLKGYACPAPDPADPTNPALWTVRPASQIIWEAAQYYSINPKLILATLEKEQSLITGLYHDGGSTYPLPAGQTHGTEYHLNYAMGAGVYPGSPNYYPGFGNQVWAGTKKLGQTDGPYAWFPGKLKTVTIYSWARTAEQIASGITTMAIAPLNQPTWNSYTYTPYYPQKRVWDLWVKFFDEDPLGSPALKPVYRFYNLKTGTHFYTGSAQEKFSVQTKWPTIYRYEGVSYRINGLNAENAAPLYRFYNLRTGVHFYTADENEKDNVIAKLGYIYRYEGPAYNVSLNPGGTPVYRFFNTKAGTHFYTADEAEKNNVIAKLGYLYRFEGVSYYLAP